MVNRKEAPKGPPEKPAEETVFSKARRKIDFIAKGLEADFKDNLIMKDQGAFVIREMIGELASSIDTPPLVEIESARRNPLDIDEQDPCSSDEIDLSRFDFTEYSAITNQIAVSKRKRVMGSRGRPEYDQMGDLVGKGPWGSQVILEREIIHDPDLWIQYGVEIVDALEAESKIIDVKKGRILPIIELPFRGESIKYPLIPFPSELTPFTNQMYADEWQALVALSVGDGPQTYRNDSPNLT